MIFLYFCNFLVPRSEGPPLTLYRPGDSQDYQSFDWSLRSEKQMDIKLFAESFKKKKMIYQKTWLLWKTHFPLMVQSKIFESI